MEIVRKQRQPVVADVLFWNIPIGHKMWTGLPHFIWTNQIHHIHVCPILKESESSELWSGELETSDIWTVGSGWADICGGFCTGTHTGVGRVCWSCCNDRLRIEPCLQNSLLLQRIICKHIIFESSFQSIFLVQWYWVVWDAHLQSKVALASSQLLCRCCLCCFCLLLLQLLGLWFRSVH